MRQQAADSASLITSIASPVPPPRKPRGTAVSGGAQGSAQVAMELRCAESLRPHSLSPPSLPPPAPPPRRAGSAARTLSSTSSPTAASAFASASASASQPGEALESVVQRSSAGVEAGGTARFANDGPSKPELAWLTTHVAQVEAAEATEEAEAILEDTYKREVEPAPAPMKSLRLRGGAPLPPGVPARGKRLSLTLQREVSSREHRSMSRSGGSVVPCYLAALHPLAAWLGRGGGGGGGVQGPSGPEAAAHHTGRTRWHHRRAACRVRI